MFLRSNDTLGDLRPWIQVVGIKVTHLETGNQQSAQTLVDIGFLDVATSYGLWQIPVFRTAFHVSACQHSLG